VHPRFHYRWLEVLSYNPAQLPDNLVLNRGCQPFPDLVWSQLRFVLWRGGTLPSPGPRILLLLFGRQGMLHTIQPVFVALKRILAGILWRVDPSQSCWYCICVFCNRQKSNRTQGTDAESGEQVALFNPRQEPWSVHFAWSANRLYIIGQTPIGRATVAALNMNRERVIPIRMADVVIDRHPPEGDPILEQES
jgi:hypothetical protein